MQVLGGASCLFLQGFAEADGELPSWRANDTAVITVPGNRFPLAVGVMECDIHQAKAGGMKVCRPTPR
jgi:predicted ribosome-associated RNA-binding protein Tma20